VCSILGSKSNSGVELNPTRLHLHGCRKIEHVGSCTWASHPPTVFRCMDTWNCNQISQQPASQMFHECLGMSHRSLSLQMPVILFVKTKIKHGKRHQFNVYQVMFFSLIMCHYDLHAYLTGAALVIWAVILVYYNGVFHIDHDSVLKKNVPHKAVAGSPPGLDSNTVLSPGEGNGFNCYILYTSFYQIFPQAPNAAKSNWTVNTYGTTKTITLRFFFLWMKDDLIPCPGPHAMSSIHKLVVPGPMEMQSSPVRILELRMVTWEDIWTWMPSVLGLFPSAKTFTPCTFTFWHPLNTMWNIWLFNEVNPLIAMLFELVKANVWTQHNRVF